MPDNVTPLPRQALRGAELSATDRLLHLFDHDSFVEIGAGVCHRSQSFGMQHKRLPGDGVVCGYGRIDGRTVYAYSQDRMSMGGSLGEAHALKIARLMDLAGMAGKPIVGINDSGGARIQEGVEALCGYGEIFKRNVRYSGVVPQISLIYGPCAGGAVYSPALTDIKIMLAQQSYMFVTGPKVVKAVTSEQVDADCLGGARVHGEQSGVAHFVVPNEEAGLLLTQQLLGYLPSCGGERPPFVDSTDAYQRPTPELIQLVPKQTNLVYDVKQVIAALVDQHSFLEIRSGFACNMVCGLARLHGYPIGIVANNPSCLAGVIDINAARKAAHFVRFCNSFQLPIVTLVDVPGFMPGVEQEHHGIIDHGAKLAFAYAEATIPKITVILRKAYGGAYIVMGSKHLGGDVNLAWPGAEIAVMGAEAAVDVLFAKELRNHADPQAYRQTMVTQYSESFVNPTIALERGYVDAIVMPADTRAMLCKSLYALIDKQQTLPVRRNANLPL